MSFNLFRNRIVVGAGALAMVATLALGALALPARTALAQDPTPTPDVAAAAANPVDLTPTPAAAVPVTNFARTITVVGDGKVQVKPDVAYLNLGVVTTRASVREASSANQAIISEVLAAVQAVGVDEKDIQTSNFSVSANNYGPSGPLPDSEITYQVANNVNVTIRDFESVSKVLDTAIEAGANNIYGVNFALRDSAAAQAEARQAAVADARARAEDLAMLTGVAVGDLISISEVVGNTAFAGSFRENAMGIGGGTPIQPGQIDLTMQIQVVYAIAPAAAQ